MTIVINRPPVAPTVAPRGDRHDPLLTLRVSDGYTWAHEFGASDASELRDGAFEAFVALTLEWQRRADALPAHQTINRAAVLRSMPHSLQLQVLDTSGITNQPNWVSANYGSDPMRMIVVQHPGDARTPDAWAESDWPTYWRRCLRAWMAMTELAQFLRGLSAPGGLFARVSDAIREAGDDAEAV
jgi:hypothetical protein